MTHGCYGFVPSYAAELTDDSMTDPAPVQPLPQTVKAAATILAAYGTVVLLYAVVLQTMIGWNQAQAFPRAIIRFLGMALIAWGLLKRARWAWWFGVLLPGFFLVLGLVALVTFLTVAKDVEKGVEIPVPPGFLPIAVFSGAAMAAVVALLLTRSSRATFRRPAA
jgi:Na+/alanine symporter